MTLVRKILLLAATLSCILAAAGCAGSSSGGGTTTYTVTFHRNATTDDSVTYTQSIAANTETALTDYATIKEANDAWARTDYTFTGWATSATATDVDHANHATVTLDDDLDLYALWKANNVTVTFYPTGGAFSDGAETKTQAVANGIAATLSSAETLGLTRTGYIFAGWATAADATAATYTDSGSITVSEDTSLYALWTPVYTVSFDANGGSGEMTALTVLPGESVTLSANTFTRTGCAFVGWGTTATANEAAYTDGASFTPTESLKLYAIWRNVSVSDFKLLDGSDITVEYDESTYTFTATPPNSSVTYTYQWILNDVDVSGDEATSTLTITSDIVTSASLVSEKSYDLVVTATQTSGLQSDQGATAYTAQCIFLYSAE